MNQVLHYRLTNKELYIGCNGWQRVWFFFASGPAIFYLKKRKIMSRGWQNFFFSAYFTNKIRISIVIFRGYKWFGECYVWTYNPSFALFRLIINTADLHSLDVTNDLITRQTLTSLVRVYSRKYYAVQQTKRYVKWLVTSICILRKRLIVKYKEVKLVVCLFCH